VYTTGAYQGAQYLRRENSRRIWFVFTVAVYKHRQFVYPICAFFNIRWNSVGPSTWSLNLHVPSIWLSLSPIPR